MIMRRWARWLADYWYVPLMSVGAIIVWIAWARWSSSTRPPFQAVIEEVATIDVGRRVRAVELEMGAAEAKTYVEAKYAETRKRLDAEDAATALELSHDPVALAKYLDRVSRRDP